MKRAVEDLSRRVFMSRAVKAVAVSFLAPAFHIRVRAIETGQL